MWGGRRHKFQSIVCRVSLETNVNSLQHGKQTHNANACRTWVTSCVNGCLSVWSAVAQNANHQTYFTPLVVTLASNSFRTQFKHHLTEQALLNGFVFGVANIIYHNLSLSYKSDTAGVNKSVINTVYLLLPTHTFLSSLSISIILVAKFCGV